MKFISLIILLLLFQVNRTIAQKSKDSLLMTFKNASIIDTARITAGIELEKIYFVNGELDSSMLTINKVLSICKPGIHNKYIAKLLGNKGISFYMRGDLKTAKKYFENASILSKQLKDSIMIIKCIGNIANIDYKMGDYDAALDNYYLTLKYLYKKKLVPEMCKTLGNIASVYDELGLYALAKKNQLLTIKIRTAKKDFANLSYNYVNLGSIYSEINIIDSAKYYFKQALNIALSHNQQSQLGLIYFNLGELEAIQLNFNESTRFFYKSLKEYEAIDDRYGVVQTKEAIACNIFELGEIKEATKIFEEIYPEALEIGGQKYIIAISNSLYECYYQLGNYKKAVEYLRFSTEKRKELDKVEIAEEVKNQKIKFEYQQKEDKLINEQEISNLILAEKIRQKNLQRNAAFIIIVLFIISFIIYFWQRNRIRKEKENSLKYLLSDFEMKALRSQINTHFIYNALNGINRFIYEKMPDKAASYVSKFANLLRITVEHTRNSWVEMDQELIAIQLYVELESLNQQEPINFTIEVSPEIDATKTLVPPMLLQPLVENAFKHSAWVNSPSFKLGLFIILENGNLSISIVDNGPSILEKDILIKNEGLSLATKNIRERLSILNQQEKSASSIALIQENTKFGLSTVSKLIIPYKID